MLTPRIPPPGRPGNRRRPPAFTLVETLGVLTLIALLTLIVLQSVVGNIKQSKRTAENISMTSIASALKATIVSTQSIPSPNTWAQAVASFMGLAVNQITTTATGQGRVLLLDPALRISSNSTQVLPYTQTAAGSIQPVSPRVILVSSLVTPLPTLTNDAVTFSNLWNTSANGVPAGWSSAWGGKGQDLCVLRLDFSTLFHRVVLENLDGYHTAPYSVQTTNNLATVNTNTGLVFWLLDGTRLNFHFPDYTLEASEYITEDVSYTFENGLWGRYVRYGQNTSNGWFGAMVDQFLAAPQPPYNTRRFSSQRWIVEAMYLFLWDFGQWSLDNFASGPPWPHQPGYDMSSTGASDLEACSGDLLP